MHLKSLKVFCDVVARRSFSRAADENGISQSGASQIVHQLEDYLGVKLFDRSKRPLVLTTAGEVYYDGCRNLVGRFRALEDEVRTLHQEVAGRVRVAAINSVHFGQFKTYLDGFLDSHPKADVSIDYQHPPRVYEMIENDQADLGIVSYAKSSRTIEALAWREEAMVVVCSPDSPLAAASQIKLSELAGLRMVSFDRELRIRREIDKALALSGVEVELAMEFDNINTIKEALAANAGFGILPEPSVSREVDSGALVAISLVDPCMIRPVGIVHRRGRPLGATASRFIQHLQSNSGDQTTRVNGRVSDCCIADRHRAIVYPSTHGDGNA